jgi:hypothetical protein
MNRFPTLNVDPATGRKGFNTEDTEKFRRKAREFFN